MTPRDASALVRRLITESYRIPPDLIDILESAEKPLDSVFDDIDKTAEYNQLRLLRSFQENGVTDYHLNGSTGYGYGDPGRDALEAIYADYFGCEAALVRSQIVSGTHALAIGLFGCLRPGDTMISAAGAPYDTLRKVIGVEEDEREPDSLVGSGVVYREIPLRENGRAASAADDSVIDLPRLLGAIDDGTRLVLLQKSKGYCWRESITNAELKKVIAAIKTARSDVICLVDNCYCEMVEVDEPGAMGADLVIGSLIKNPGGTLAPCGGYIAGKRDLVQACANRLLAPGLRSDMGASLGFQRLAFQGLFQAPQVVAQSLKGAWLGGEFFHRLGYPVTPEAFTRVGPGSARSDIVQAIRLGDCDKLIRFCGAIQRACPVDAAFAPEPAMLPGYSHSVVMAGGGFVQGSSGEFSADGPLKPPYIVYVQGGFSLAQIKLGLLLAAKELRG